MARRSAKGDLGCLLLIMLVAFVYYFYKLSPTIFIVITILVITGLVSRLILKNKRKTKKSENQKNILREKNTNAKNSAPRPTKQINRSNNEHTLNKRVLTPQHTETYMLKERLVNEVLEFYDAIPRYEEITQEQQLNLNHLIATDLGRISLICGYADGRFDSNESLVELFFTVGVLMGEEYLKTTLSSWDYLTYETKEKFKKINNDFLDSVRKQSIKQLESPSIIRILDKETGQEQFHKIANQFYRFANKIVKADGHVSKSEEKALKEVWRLIFEVGIESSSQKVNEMAKITITTKEETLDSILIELYCLIGMSEIKEEVQSLINFLKIQKERTERGLSKTALSLHTVFYGPPGTGKTTVARFLGRIYKQMGFLAKGHLIETDRSGLVGGYLGQTALKTNKLIDSALGGVLFIDEAYSLKPENSNMDYGQEAIDILLKRMEDDREQLVVVVAGYTDEMQRFLESNPGVRSRFNRYFNFDHYNPDELLAIFEKFCHDSNFVLSTEAKEKARLSFTILFDEKDRTFGNGRLARNYFEKSVERQANRIAGCAQITEELLITLIEDDIPPPAIFINCLL